MELDGLAGFERAVMAFTLAWPTLALLLAWSRTAPARAMRWLAAAVMAGAAFVVHLEFALQPGASNLRVAAVVGLALCVATAVRLAVVTDSLGARWSLLSSPLARVLSLMAAWGALSLVVRAAIQS